MTLCARASPYKVVRIGGGRRDVSAERDTPGFTGKLYSLSLLGIGGAIGFMLGLMRSMTGLESLHKIVPRTQRPWKLQSLFKTRRGTEQMSHAASP